MSDENETPSEPRALPLLPLRDIIVFPHMSVPLFVGRPRSIAAVERAVAGKKQLVLAAQKRPKTNEPTLDDIFPIGTIAEILHFQRLPDGTVKILVKGQMRARVIQQEADEPCMMVFADAVAEGPGSEHEPTATTEALLRSVRESFDTYVKLSRRIQSELLVSISTIQEPGIVADTIAAALPLKLADKQALLELESPDERLQKLFELLQSEIEILQVEKKLRSKVKKQMEKRERDMQMSEQMQPLGRDSNDGDEFKNEIAELEEKIAEKRMSKEATTRLQKELKKLKQMSPMSAEATVIRNYIDWVLALPWDERTVDQLEIGAAQKILDEDHYGLAKVKERVIEYLAVQTLVKKIKGPILCLVGPPGVGKTSLARSIARATGRKFVRLALGGVRDEAEIRGHRRTYIGALPGKIIQSLRKAGSNNPVFLLDEVDKMSSDFRGDPSAALLEVLDPEQNQTFNDHYLDLDYDLSDVLFITTANNLHSIPAPLQDRMEIITLPGYTEWEKIAIAEQHLLPKTKAENGISEIPVELGEASIRAIITQYTKEAGVRNLEREISTIFRKIAREVLAQKDEPKGDSGGETGKFVVTPRNLPKYLGPHKHRAGKVEERDEVGLCNGLAVTMHGGDILPAEVTIVPGKGKLVLTGKLGDVMQESAHAAMSYVRSRADWLGLDREFYAKIDIHVHFPEGAIPKDGPSAGVTMATALVSALLRAPVRREVAMTGEITLRGRVLPIGGLKEKVLAAHRAGISTVIMPKENRKDLQDIPARVLKSVKIVAVEHMDEVLRVALAVEALQRPSSPIDWRTQAEPPAPAPAPESTH